MLQDREAATKVLRPAPAGRQRWQRSVVERRHLSCVQQQVELPAVEGLEDTGAQLGELHPPDVPCGGEHALGLVVIAMEIRGGHLG